MTVENTGSVPGEEVVQLYLSDLEASAPVPIRSLVGMQRVHLQPAEQKRLSFVLTARQLSLIDAQGDRVVQPGLFELSVGGKQPGFAGTADAPTTGVVMDTFEVKGETYSLSTDS